MRSLCKYYDIAEPVYHQTVQWRLAVTVASPVS